MIFQTDADDFVETDGPSGNGLLWHFIDYGGLAYFPDRADYFNGTADFQLSQRGQYMIFIRGVSWLNPFPEGEYATTPIFARE